MPIAFTRSALGALALLTAATPALAEVVSYHAELAGSDEVPPNHSKATGRVVATYDTATRKLVYTIEFEGLSGEVISAHFHGAATPGANGGLEFAVPALTASPIRGEAVLGDAQSADLEKDMWYLNIHSSAYPMGEIRGRLTAESPPRLSADP